MHAVRFGEDNPIAARNIRQLETPLTSWATEKTNAADWAHYINPKKTAAPKEAEALLKSHKPFCSGSAQKKRDSIGALQALQLVIQMDNPPSAAYSTWKCSLFVPQNLLVRAQGGGEAYLLLAVAANCCRACKVFMHPSSTHHQMRFLLDLRAEWEWLTIVDLQSWLVQPYKWAINESEPDKHSYFCMISTFQALTAEAAVLCRAKKPVSPSSRHAVVNAAMPSPDKGKNKEEQLIHSRLEPLPEEDAKFWKSEWLQTILSLEQSASKARERLRKKQAAQAANVEWSSSDDDSDIASDHDDCPDNVRDLFYAAVDEIDSKEFAQDDARKLKGAAATARREKAKVARAFKQSGQTQKKALVQASEVDLEAKDRFAKRSKLPWVRKFVPDASGALQATLQCVDTRNSWTARFGQTWDVPPGTEKGLEHDAYSKKTHSRSHKDGGLSQHQCFQQCLRWLWLKQKILDPDCEVPEFVQQELAVCAKCTATPKESCNHMDTLFLMAPTDAEQQLPVLKPLLKGPATPEPICSAPAKTPKSKVASKVQETEQCSFCGDKHNVHRCPFLPGHHVSHELLSALYS